MSWDVIKSVAIAELPDNRLISERISVIENNCHDIAIKVFPHQSGLEISTGHRLRRFVFM
jgi:hypothetical protein